jgi:hypothetical protein
VRPGLCAADDGTKSNEKDIVKPMVYIVMSGVLDGIEVFVEMTHW